MSTEKSNQVVRLSSCTVELEPNLTWGMQEEVRAAMYGGLKVGSEQNIEFDASAITRAKYKAIEVCVKKITLGGGTDITYSKDWLDSLSVEDGDLLYEEVNKITNPAKK